MDRESVEAVRNHRAGRTSRLVVGPEHEVVDQELRAAAEQIRQRAVLVRLESVLLIDPDPRQRLALLRQFVAAAREFLLGLEQIEPCVRAILPEYQSCVIRCSWF